MKLSVLIAAVAGATITLQGCSTIIEGTSQEITIGTVPPEASCELKRDGVVIGLVPSTPGSVTIKKNKQNIMITCKKEGYKDANLRNESDFAGATAGNLILGGIIGIGIDAATGAANKYDGDVIITLEPLEATTPGTPAPSIAPATDKKEPTS